MLTHFQFKPLFENKKIPGWQFSFYFKRKNITGIYHPNGDIEWSGPQPEEDDENLLKKQLHELMLFHVYDER